MEKIIGILILLLLPYQLQAAQVACKCNCDLADASLCAPSYDLDNPCPSVCPSTTASPFPPPRTACPTQKVFIPEKGAFVWVTFCPD